MLWVCATPIGNLGDVTLRVLDALRDADLIAAEDTRRTRKLLSHYDIHTPLTSFFAHNEAAKTEYVLGELRAGKSVALVTDAGLPGVSDPGTRLVAAALTAGLDVTVLPGPSAPVTALVASGLSGDAGFRFVGYLPRRRRDLQEAWRLWRREGGAVVAFESPHRLVRSLTTLAESAPQSRAAVCRELTKLHEEVARGTLAELAARYATAASPARGEITLVVDAGAGSTGRLDGRAAEPEGLTPGAKEAPVVSPGGAGRAPAVAAAGAGERPAAGELSPELEEAAAGAERLLQKGLSKRDAAAALAILLGIRKRTAEEIVRAAAGRLVD
jgi:16S rRNA (cytidine1402-2'-O)-methyltransferase